MRKLMLFVSMLAVLAGLSGCFFDNPLTGIPSKDLNTWLLGVWEHKTDKGDVYKVSVTPKSSGRYWVNFQKVGPTAAKTKTWEFEAWSSRVGQISFLTMHCLTSAGEIPVGSYVFVHTQLLDQENIRTRIPLLEEAQGLSSFEIRKVVRRKFKEGTLFGEGDHKADWNRVSEVYWSGSSELQPFQPLRYPPVPTPPPVVEKVEEVIEVGR